MNTLEFMGGGSIVDLEGSYTGAQHGLGTWHGVGTLHGLGAQHGLGARHGLWLLGMVFGCSPWSRNLVSILGHISNF